MKKWIILVAVLVGAGIGLALFSYLADRTLWNEENVTGNTAGNLINGGLFCEDGDTIYFANPNDDSALYSMNQEGTEFKKIHSDHAASINVTSNYLVYVRDNHARTNGAGNFFNFYSTGIFRVKKKDGSGIKMLYNKPAGVVSLWGNTIYYQHYNSETNLEFYKVRLDGSEEENLSTEPIVPASITNGTLYYNGVDNDHNIHAWNLNGNQTFDVAYGNYFSVLSQNGYLYYLNLADRYSIGRMSLDGSEAETLVSERCSFFNLSPNNRYLFYQVDGGDNNRICQLDLLSMESTTILDGDYTALHTTTDSLFFQDFHTEQWYRYYPSSGKLFVFDPPVL